MFWDPIKVTPYRLTKFSITQTCMSWLRPLIAGFLLCTVFRSQATQCEIFFLPYSNPFLPARCRCRGLLLRLITLCDTHTHTHTHIHTAWDEGAARRGDLNLSASGTRKRQMSLRRESNPQSLQQYGRRSKPRSLRPQWSAPLEAVLVEALLKSTSVVLGHCYSPSASYTFIHILSLL